MAIASKMTPRTAAAAVAGLTTISIVELRLHRLAASSAFQGLRRRLRHAAATPLRRLAWNWCPISTAGTSPRAAARKFMAPPPGPDLAKPL